MKEELKIRKNDSRRKTYLMGYYAGLWSVVQNVPNKTIFVTKEGQEIYERGFNDGQNELKHNLTHQRT